MALKRQHQSPPRWVIAGLASVTCLLVWGLIVKEVCDPTTVICRTVDGVFVAMAVPEGILVNPILHRLSALLGIRRLGSEMVVATPAASAILTGVAWFFFLLYWFVLGIAVHALFRLLLRRFGKKSPSA